MLVSEIATRVRNQFNDDAAIQVTDAHIMRWVNDAMREIALNNTLLQVKGTTTSIADETDYGIPDNLLSLHTVRYDGVKLKQYSLQEADGLISPGVAVSSGTPEFFYIEAGNFVLYPAPDTTGTVITMIYTRQPTDVTLTSDTPEIPLEYHNRIVEYCLAQAAEMDGDSNLAMLKMQQFEGKVALAKHMSEEGADLYPSITVSARDGWYDDFD